MTSILKKKLNKKGFTLAELLVVVAIIAILVAIAIPVFGGQLQKAKQATDAANVRATYAELVADAMMNNSYDASGNISIDASKIKSVTSAENNGNGSTVVCTDSDKITVTLSGTTSTIEVDDNVKFTNNT